MKSSKWGPNPIGWCPHKKWDLTGSLSLSTSAQKWGHVKAQWLSTSQEERSYQKSTLLTPWSWISRLQNGEKISVYCLSHPVCDILLFKPKQTNTMGETIMYIKFIAWKWSQQKIWHDIEQLMEHKKRLSIWPWHWKNSFKHHSLLT